jgi:hypothetical protein
MSIDVAILLDRFEYKDGDLYYKRDVSNRIRAGTKAGTINSKGYLQTRVLGKIYMNHRIVFAMHRGYWPAVVDHKDGNPLNNCIENLRACTMRENSYNQKLHKLNTSGFKNVQWNKKFNKWRVSLTVDGKEKHIGHFEDLEFAAFAAEEARNKFHGQFARSV